MQHITLCGIESLWQKCGGGADWLKCIMNPNEKSDNQDQPAAA